MNNFLQSIRAIVGLFLLVSSLLLTFKGFPLALVSFLGSFLVLMGYTVAISVLTHSDTAVGSNAWQRVLSISLGFAVASIGGAIIKWGGLLSVNIWEFEVSLYTAGVVAGVVGGLFNVDKEMIR